MPDGELTAKRWVSAVQFKDQPLCTAKATVPASLWAPLHIEPVTVIDSVMPPGGAGIGRVQKALLEAASPCWTMKMEPPGSSQLLAPAKGGCPWKFAPSVPPPGIAGSHFSST